MATPLPVSRDFEFIVRRTFWFPVLKIIFWSLFVYGLDVLVSRLGIVFDLSFHEGRLDLFFDLLVLFGTLWILFEWNSTRYTITNERIVSEKGILNVDRNTFLFRNIECVKLHKNFLGRLCWYGTIEMYAPTLQEHVFLKNIGNAKKYARLIQKSIARQRRKELIYPSATQQRSNFFDRMKTA
jgi:uncharacterized membrane protein YdbT with pleckstrin-like domain